VSYLYLLGQERFGIGNEKAAPEETGDQEKDRE
jgi:hypothetical protein